MLKELSKNDHAVEQGSCGSQEAQIVGFTNGLVRRPKTMSSVEIADISGKLHKHVLEAIRKMEPAWEKVSGTKFRLANYLDEQGKERPMFKLTLRECMYVATKFNDEARAKLVLRWEELETVPKMQPVKAAPEVAILFIDCAARLLNMNENSKLLMITNAAKTYGLDANMFPAYTKSVDILLPLSKTLDGTGISAVSGNKALETRGVIQKKYRTGKGGVEKWFWSIAPQYAHLGENQVSPHNPQETQPMWYECRRNEIIELATYKIAVSV